MKKIKLYTIAAIASLLPLFSCEDFLDLNPTTQPSETTFWKTENDFNMALAGIYVEKSEYAVTSNELKNQFDIPIQLFLSCIGYQ